MLDRAEPGALRRALAILSVVVTAALPVEVAEAAPPDDEAEEAEEVVVPAQSAPATKQVIVVVQQPAPTEAPAAPSGVPRVGDSAERIDAYLSDLKQEVRRKKDALRDAKRDGEGEDEAERALREADIHYKEERDRLTQQEPGLIAGGAVLTSAGAVSFVASGVLLVVWLVSSVDLNPDDKYGWASLACLGGGFLGLGAGIPMIVIGAQRTPRDPYEALLAPRPVGFAPPLGLTATWSF